MLRMEDEMGLCTAIVLAAGAGKRMQSAVAKQYMLLNDKPILWYALHAFEKSDVIQKVVLVVGEGEISYCQQEIVEKYGFSKVTDVIQGGAERYLSVWEGLKCLEPTEGNYVFIHDGARPFVDEEIIRGAYDAVKEFGACVVGMPVKDTIKVADEYGFAAQTPDRNTLWAVQTPQVFEEKLIYDAYKQLIEDLSEWLEKGLNITDDAMVLETVMKKKVKLVKGSYENIKITTPEDIFVAESFLK